MSNRVCVGSLPSPVCSLGYEYHHQQNLKTMRGAKSNALLFGGANCHPGCPCVTLFIVYTPRRNKTQCPEGPRN
jgi:hypothetical protein